MIRKLTFAAALLAATALTGVANAKTLVYCSEASPAGFDPGALDRRQRLRRLLAHHLQPPRRVRARHDQPSCPASPRAGTSPTTASNTRSTCARASSSRPPTTSRRRATSTPTTSCSRSSASGRRTIRGSSICRASAGNTSPAWASRTSLKEIVKVDDLTVKFVLNKPDVAVPADLGMDFASIVSKEYADQLEAAGTQGAVQPAADRHRPVPVRRLPDGRGHPLRGL